LHRFSEPFPPHGALAAEGAANLLGRPRLDPLVVLVREAVQNSWDARRDDDGITFDADLHRLTHVERDALRGTVFVEPPSNASVLRDVLRRDEIRLLSLTDKGTRGLGGPVRADRPAPRGEPSNFVDLMFNIGQPAEREARGGTYGFGRTIAYVVSQARAVVVYSRTASGRRRESRFISAAFTDHFAEGSRRYTGRHWWGAAVDGSIEPVVGDRADQLAEAIGLDRFAADETGTTIAIVEPDLRGRTPEQACNFLATALTWNFWPKMLTDGGGAAIRFGVSCEGEPVAVPEPARTPPLPAFVSSLRAVRAAATDDVRTTVDEIVLPRTGETIGRLAITRTAFEPRVLVDDGADELEERGSAAAFEGPSHHVALVRDPELVVQYLPTADLASGTEEYGGVFKPQRNLDRAFAMAEPPTHDAWHPELVGESKLRRYVAVALRGVRDRADRQAGQSGGLGVDGDVAAVAEALDDLFVGSGASGGGAPTLPRVTVGPVHLDRRDDHLVTAVPFTVEHAPSSHGTTVDAVAHRASHDGWIADRSEPPTTAWTEVVGFSPTSDAGDLVVEGSRLVVTGDDARDWHAIVRSRAGIAVALDLTPQPVEASA
jgi:hypothetical protein